MYLSPRPSEVRVRVVFSCHREGCLLVSHGDLAFLSLKKLKKQIR